MHPIATRLSFMVAKCVAGMNDVFEYNVVVDNVLTEEG